MGFFHYPSGNACFVCLAGAVMARRLGVPPAQETGPGYFDDYTRDRLWDLNSLRSEVDVYYHENPERFHAEMSALADRLEAEERTAKERNQP